MKKVITLFLIVMLLSLISACASQTGKAERNNSGDLPDPASFRQQDRGSNFIETEEFHFCLNDEKVYFSKKDNLGFYLLCNKPNCTHNDKECNAFDRSMLGYWDGHLYGAFLFGENPYLFRMNLDGTEHKKIADIEMPVNAAGAAGGAYQFYVHNGFAYYIVGNEEMNACFRTEFATGKTERLFEDLLLDNTWFYSGFHFDGKNFYFVLRDISGEDALYCGSTETLALQKNRKWSSEICSWSVYDEVLYYYASDRAIFCEYDLTTGEEKTFSQQDYHGGAANYDDDYIYLTTWDDDDFGGKGLSIFDQNYQFLQRVSYRPNQELLYITQDKLIFTDLPSQKATKYLPKSAIGTGEAELLPIEDPYSYR